MLVSCSHCKKEINKSSFQTRLYKNSYCSSVCRSLHITTKVIVFCKLCNRKVKRTPSELKKVKNTFCSKKCANHHNNIGRRNNYKDGRGSYRSRAIKKYGAKCCKKDCPIQASGINIPIVMLDVDHINGKEKGHDVKNLQVLCVWCHAVKTRKGFSSRG